MDVATNVTVAQVENSVPVAVHISLMCVAFPGLFVGGILAARSGKMGLHKLLQATGYLCATVALLVGATLGKHAAVVNGGDASFSIHGPLGFVTWILLTCQVVFGASVLCSKVRDCHRSGRTAACCALVTKAHTRVLGFVVLALFYPLTLSGVAHRYELCTEWPMNCVGHWILGTCLLVYGLFSLQWNMSFQWRPLAEQERAAALKRRAECGCLALFGACYTLAEHDWSSDFWHMTDIEHIAAGGIPYLTGGLLGLIIECLPPASSSLIHITAAVSSQQHVCDFIPGLLFLLTGAAMSNHDQDDQFAKEMHVSFGHALMTTGILRALHPFLTGERARNIGIMSSVGAIAAAVILIGSSHGVLQRAYLAIHGDATSYTLYLMATVFVVIAYSWTVFSICRRATRLRHSHGNGPESEHLAIATEVPEPDTEDSADQLQLTSSASL